MSAESAHLCCKNLVQFRYITFQYQIKKERKMVRENRLFAPFYMLDTSDDVVEI